MEWWWSSRSCCAPTRFLYGRFGAALTAVVLAGGRAGGTGDGGNGVAGIVGNVGMAGIDGDEIGYEG